MGAVGDIISDVVSPVIDFVAGTIEDIPIVGDVVESVATFAGDVVEVIEDIPIVGDVVETVLDVPLVSQALDFVIEYPIFSTIEAASTISQIFGEPDAAIRGVGRAAPPGRVFSMNGFDEFGDIFGGILDDFNLSDLGGVVQTGFNIASAFDGFGGGMVQPVARAGPGTAMVPMGRAKIPILASLAAKGLWDLTGKMTQYGKLILGYLRRFGPTSLIALGFTAAEVANLLFHSTKKRGRRMNPLNPKALGRSIRRLSGFEKRACRVQAMLSSVATKTRRKGRRCIKCRRSPCVCG